MMKLNAGNATADDHRAFEAWRLLNDENECAAREAEGLWTDVDRLYADPSASLEERRRKAKSRVRRHILFGTAVLAGGGIGLGWRNGFRGWTADYATGMGETRVVGLSDGSRVTLNACSGIALRFSAVERRVSLVVGQGFFEVASGGSRPFKVETGPVVVTALGTAFDVNRNLADGAVAVSVTEHGVRVETETTSASREVAVLHEGQTVVADSLGRLGTIRSRAASVTSAWRHGTYVAENTRLGDVVKALGSYHPGWILLQGADTTDIRVSAVLDLTAADRSLDALADGLPISIRRLSPYLVIVSGR